jgi:hypothetical protein
MDYQDPYRKRELLKSVYCVLFKLCHRLETMGSEPTAMKVGG